MIGGEIPYEYPCDHQYRCRRRFHVRVFFFSHVDCMFFANISTRFHDYSSKCQAEQYCCLIRLLPPSTKLRQGNIFTPVCQSFCSQGVSASGLGGVCQTPPRQTPPHPGQIPPGQTPPWADTPLGRHPPARCMLGYGQQAGGTHPTGMHTCLKIYLLF